MTEKTELIDDILYVHNVITLYHTCSHNTPSSVVKSLFGILKLMTVRLPPAPEMFSVEMCVLHRHIWLVCDNFISWDLLHLLRSIQS